jgi:hypothetical protein
VDNSASIQPARSIFISWGKSVQISGATSVLCVRTQKTISHGIEVQIETRLKCQKTKVNH